MTSLRRLSLLLIVIFTSFGCSSQKTLFLADGVIKNTSGSTFLVVPFNQNWTPDATKKRMRGQEIDLFYQALSPSFSSNTPNRVSVVRSDLKLAESNFTKKILSAENQNLTINIPSDTLLSTLDERYIYFLEGYKFQLIQKSGDRVSYAYQQSESKIALQFETEYFLYDQRNSEIVAWGTVSDDSEIQGRPQFVDYLTVLTKVSRKIIQESPFLLN